MDTFVKCMICLSTQFLIDKKREKSTFHELWTQRISVCTYIFGSYRNAKQRLNITTTTKYLMIIFFAVVVFDSPLYCRKAACTSYHFADCEKFNAINTQQEFVKKNDWELKWMNETKREKGGDYIVGREKERRRKKDSQTGSKSMKDVALLICDFYPCMIIKWNFSPFSKSFYYFTRHHVI